MRHVDRHAAAAARQPARRVPPAPERDHPHDVQAILGLQATAGNAAVSLMLQRAPAHAQQPRETAALRELRGSAAQLTLHLSALIGNGGRSYGPGDVAAMSEFEASFFRRLYQVLWDRRFGGPEGRLPAGEREADLLYVRTTLPAVIAEVSFDPGGLRVVKQIQHAVDRHASGITRSAMMDRAYRDADLEAKLNSFEVADERVALLAALQKGYSAYAKFSKMIESTAPLAGGQGARVATILKDARTGLDAASAVVKAIDPESYRTAVKEAREWCREHQAGVGLQLVRAVQLESVLVELTIGTVTKVAGTLSHAAIWALKPTGVELEALLELAKTGEVVSTAGKITDRIAHFLEKVEKFEKVIGALALAAGVAKLATAETTSERIDAGVTVGTTGLTFVGKVTGRAALGSAASSVLATWEMVKFFGDMGAGAIEGSMYAGLRQELAEIRPLADRVALAIVPLDRALGEQDRRFGETMVSPERAGSDDVVETLAYYVQQDLRKASERWLDSRIHALARWYRKDVQVSVGQALQADYPASIVLQTGTEFMGALADAYHNLPAIVIDMLEDDGFMTHEQASRERRKLAEKRREAAEAAEAAARAE